MDTKSALGSSLVVLVALAMAGHAAGDTDRSGYREEAANHRSFVRGAANNTMLLDKDYVDGLARLSPTKKIDVFMQQCYGGGFLNEFAAGRLNNATLSTSSGWDEIAHAKFSNFLSQLDDYTRASTEAHIRNFAITNRKNFFASRDNLPNGVTFDPAYETTPLTTSGEAYVEGKQHMHYWSNDPAPGPGAATPNSDRTLIHSNAAGQPRQYAILVQWDKPGAEQKAFDVQIARQYDMLTRRYGVPADNIVVLMANRANTLMAADANWTMNGMPNGLPAVPINEDNSLPDFSNAIKGNYFRVNGQYNQEIVDPSQRNMPTANDKLYIFNTGHGSHTEDKKFLLDDGVFKRQFVDTRTTGSIMLKPSLVNDPLTGYQYVGSDGLVQVQLTTSMPLNTVFLQLNGRNAADGVVGSVSPFAPTLLTNPVDVLDIRPLLELAGLSPSHGSLFTYEMRVPWQYIDNASGTGIDIAFGSAFGVALDQATTDSLFALTFASGVQEYVHVFIPSPGSLLVLAGGLTITRRRQRT